MKNQNQCFTRIILLNDTYVVPNYNLNSAAKKTGENAEALEKFQETGSWAIILMAFSR